MQGRILATEFIQVSIINEQSEKTTNALREICNEIGIRDLEDLAFEQFSPTS